LFVEQGCYRGWQRDLVADDRFDGVVEFYRVCGLEEQAFVAWVFGEPAIQCQPAYCSMRIGQVVVMGVEFADGGDRLFVGDAHAADGGLEGRKLFVEDLEDADEVAGVADVHGIGESRTGGAGFVVAGLQIDGDGIVGVAGGDKVFNGET